MPTLKKSNKKCYNSKKKEERQEIYNTSKWRKLREAKLIQNPLCEVCLEKGIIKPAEDVHHINSFMNYTGLKRTEKAFDFNNLQSICRSCHQKEHN